MNKVKIKFNICLISILILALSGCSSTGAGDGNMVSMYDLEKTMVAADDSLPEMLSANSSAKDAKEAFLNISDIDYGKVDSYFISYSKDGKLADEIVVVRMKEKSQASEMEASLREHAKNRENLYTTYVPKQAKRAGAAEIFTKDNYCVLIISDKADTVKTTFNEFVK